MADSTNKYLTPRLATEMYTRLLLLRQVALHALQRHQQYQGEFSQPSLDSIKLSKPHKRE